MIRLEYPLRDVTHLRFENRGLMSLALVRMQEHAENILFRGKTFTLTELIEESTLKLGEFDQLGTTYGVNFPASILPHFLEGQFDPLLGLERQVLDLLKNIDFEKGYVIATFRNEELEHELAHAMWHIDSEYREDAEILLRGFNGRDRKRVEDYLKRYTYTPECWENEINAYFVEGKIGTFNLAKLKESRPFRKLFQVCLEKHRNGHNSAGNGRH